MRKGAAHIGIIVIVSLILLIFVAVIAGITLNLFTGAIAPESTAKASFDLFINTVVDLRDSEDRFSCRNTGDRFFLPKDYYIMLDVTSGKKQLQLMKSTSGEPKIIDKVTLNNFADKTLCCSAKLDNEGNCNTKCVDGEPLVIGKKKTVDDALCVCWAKANNFIVYEKNTDFTCHWAWPKDWLPW